MDTTLLPGILGIAVLVPLGAFAAIFTLGRWWRPTTGGLVATSAIALSGLLSFWALAIWLGHHPVQPAGHTAAVPAAYAGDYYDLGQFGQLRVSIGYYIDALTVVMFCTVSFIAFCIHVYAWGYMHEELQPVTDPEVIGADGAPLTRRGRFGCFFQYMSLFCFSMLGLVLAGNILMVFVFWELVGICSYFLIGFYIERRSACLAANKAFIVNRIGDCGMLVGMMALWSGLGTFAFGDVDRDGNGLIEPGERGIFSLVRPAEQDYALTTPAGMVWADAQGELVRWRQAHPEVELAAVHEYALSELPRWRDGGPDGTGPRYGYWLLTLAGIGIFCGCVGKSAQFPLHVWLPDAMEGPTPVSALVHSATMVAAGVYLVGRFYAVFTAETLLVIAATGLVTLFLAATIAITATDIKRVLAYSTVSQLGYMMMALGVGGWLAGLLHLVTHACFKSLLFLCSGSVIHAVHSNDLRVMGGLWRKMPITAGTMLVGCVAITGLGIPLVIGLSGYYSKDLILEQALSFALANGGHWAGVFFLVAATGAAITAFYMFRLWFLAFAGAPRDAQRYAHAHESPRVMYVPLILLAVCAAGVAWQLPWSHFSLAGLLEQARPAGTAATLTGVWVPWGWPSEHLAHAADNHGAIVVPATLVAFTTAVAGVVLAVAMYLTGWLRPSEVSRQFAPVYRLLWNKWWFDELYAWAVVRPVRGVAQLCAACDTRWIDRLLDGLASGTCRLAVLWEQVADRRMIDGPVDRLAGWTYALGLALRRVQTGSLRQYVLFLVVGVVVMFLVSSLFL